MPSKKFPEQIRDFIRARHLSLRTEQACIRWIKRFILFHNKHHPAQMGAHDVNRFLTLLAVQTGTAAVNTKILMICC